MVDSGGGEYKGRMRLPWSLSALSQRQAENVVLKADLGNGINVQFHLLTESFPED
jgi:hypothetical protein